MSKKLFSVVLVLCLLFTALSVCAGAANKVTIYTDVTYEVTKYTSVSAAEEKTISLTGASAQSQNGITITAEVLDGTTLNVYYSGRPETAGSFTFTVNYLEGEETKSVSVPVEVLDIPDVPKIQSVSPEGSEITVIKTQAETSFQVSASGNGTLSYAWFLDGTPAGTGASFKPDYEALAEGEHVIWCVITNAIGDREADTADDSPAWRINVLENEPLTITGEAYAASIDGTGTARFSVEAKGTDLKYQWYAMDGSAKKAVSDGIVGALQYSGSQTSTLKIVCTVAPKDVSARFICEVTDGTGETAETGEYVLYIKEDPAASRVDSIEVAHKPEKTEYTEGETLILNGLEILVKMAKGDETITSGFAVDPMLLQKEGTQKITVSYGGKTTEFSVNVKKAEHEHEWTDWQVDTELGCVYRTCEVKDCTARELYSEEDFIQMFPAEAAMLNLLPEKEEKTDEEPVKEEITEPEENKSEQEEKAGKEDRKEKKKSGNGIFIVIIIIAALLLAAAIYIYFRVYQKPNSKKRK